MNQLERFWMGMQLPLGGRGRMRMPVEANRRHLAYGVFFVFLSAASLGLVVGTLLAGQGPLALRLLPGTAFMGFLGWVTIKMNREKMRGRGPGAGGLMGAGKLAPIKPSPPHQLVAMKDLPPGDRTHSVPRD